MSQLPVNQFLPGGIVLACAAAGLFFLRFWRKTRDRLSALFATTFWTLGAHWLALAFTDPGAEFRLWLYATRLLAFLLILYGVYDKNRSAGQARRATRQGRAVRR